MAADGGYTWHLVSVGGSNRPSGHAQAQPDQTTFTGYASCAPSLLAPAKHVCCSVPHCLTLTHNQMGLTTLCNRQWYQWCMALHNTNQHCVIVICPVWHGFHITSGCKCGMHARDAVHCCRTPSMHWPWPKQSTEAWKGDIQSHAQRLGSCSSC
jgi:hypothetical protein